MRTSLNWAILGYLWISMLRRLLFVALGLAAMALGALGVWLPGLPATPFVLVALWALARSNPRLHAWMRQAPLFREAIAHAERYRRDRAIDRRVKLVAVACAWTSVAILLASASPPLVVLSIVVALAIACTAFMALTKTAPYEG